MINKNELFYVLLFVLLSVLGLVAFGWMDLEFSQSIRNPGIWNTWVERLCFLPTLLAAWIQSLMLTAHWLRKQSQEDAPVLVLMLGLLSSVGLPIYVYWYEMRYFDKQSSSLGWIMIICLVAIAIWGTIRIIKKLPPREEAVRIRRATAGLVIFYGIWGLTALVSYFWGRASFRDLQTMGSYAAYTPWFRPGGQTGANMSAFTGIALCYGICISNYLTVGHNRNLRDVLVFASLLYGLFVGWACMRNGTLYGSDVIIAAGLSYAVLFAGGFLFRRFYPADAGKLMGIRHDGL